MIQELLKSWKTTSAGLLMIVGSLIHLGFSIQGGTCNENTVQGVAVGVVGGIGLMFAGDSGAPTQAKKP